jgi:hopene-associated glycosyltransferase HpnB
MHSLALTGAAICLATWIYLLLARGGFWKIDGLVSPVSPAHQVEGTIAVVIPARDEAVVIGGTIASLLAQSCADNIRIFVVDDQSCDGTAEAAHAAAAALGRPEAVTVIPGTPLPTGWTGKLWAVQQGVKRATELHPAFLLLTDADIHHCRENVATLVAIAECGSYDLTSFMVKLNCRSLAERLLVPPFVFFFFLLYPPRWIRDSRRRVAGAAGGCMLVRPAALEAAGGIAGIRGQIIDDCALARTVKRSGGSVWLGVTPETHSTREYKSFAELERMIARTAFNQLRHSSLLLFGSAVGLATTYLLPVALLFSGSPLSAALGALCWLLMAFSFAPMVRFYGLSPAWSLTLPLSASFYLFATVHSAVKYWTGRGGEWKGRAQDRAAAN